MTAELGICNSAALMDRRVASRHEEGVTAVVGVQSQQYMHCALRRT